MGKIEWWSDRSTLQSLILGGFSKHKVHFFDIPMLEETTVIQSTFKNILFHSVSHMFGSW